MRLLSRLCLTETFSESCERLAKIFQTAINQKNRSSATCRLCHAITGSFRTPPEPERVQVLVAKAIIDQTILV